MEQENSAFFEKVRRGFLKLAKQNKTRFVVLNAKKSQEEIAQKILEELERRLKRRGLCTHPLVN